MLRRFLGQIGSPNEFEELAKRVLAQLDTIPDFEERIAAKSRLVNAISQAQDVANLSIMGDFQKNDPACSKDSRWEPIHMLDNANAVFLGVTNARYDPEIFMRSGYVPEKADKLCSRWALIKWHADKNPRNLYLGGKPWKRTEAERAEARREFRRK